MRTAMLQKRFTQAWQLWLGVGQTINSHPKSIIKHPCPVKKGNGSSVRAIPKAIIKMATGGQYFHSHSVHYHQIPILCDGILFKSRKTGAKTVTKPSHHPSPYILTERTKHCLAYRNQLSFGKERFIQEDPKPCMLISHNKCHIRKTANTDRRIHIGVQRSVNNKHKLSLKLPATN
jgi:hypothetical protein